MRFLSYGIIIAKGEEETGNRAKRDLIRFYNIEEKSAGGERRWRGRRLVSVN
jgi:hypothetical protein